MGPIFEFHRFKAITEAHEIFWIGLRPTPKTHGDSYVVGRECTSLAELEAVVEALRADLDRVMDEARKELGG